MLERHLNAGEIVICMLKVCFKSVIAICFFSFTKCNSENMVYSQSSLILTDTVSGQRYSYLQTPSQNPV